VGASVLIAGSFSSTLSGMIALSQAVIVRQTATAIITFFMFFCI
jgi:hypothetical protein